MQAQIRMAESGHSYHYSSLTTVHALMHEIRKDFKIQLEDQKIIIKNGEILKSTMAFDSIQQSMKKTIPTNNSTAFNPSSLKSSEMKQIECLYIYNQKQLLKPIQQKAFNDEFYLKVLRQKCKEMSPLAENSYEFKQFNEKISEKNIISMIEPISKRLKIPFENIIQRYGRFYDNLNQRNYFKLQISSLLDLIQNQDKARKLLIRNVEWTHDKRTKKRLISIKERIVKETEKENEMSMKQNSSFFSSKKGSHCSDALAQLTRVFGELQNKNAKFYERLKKSKKEVTKQKFLQQERVTFQIDKKVTTIEKEYEENAKFVKDHFDQFCQEIIKVNGMLTKNKESKDVVKQLMFINEKIVGFERKIEDNIKEFTQMYLDLSKIHVKGETQSIKLMFGVYVELIKAYEELQSEVRRFEKDLALYKDEKSQQDVKVSQFSENRNNNLPLKKHIKSPKKQDTSQKRIQKQESSVSKQLQSNMPKINSPIKNKICKNSLKSFNDEITSKNFEIAIKENRQLGRRLEFNRRLEGLVKYCGNLCEKEQEMRRNFRNCKEFEENKIDLLGFFNVPTIDIDYNETSDVELTHLYKKWLKENSLNYDIEINWELQLVEVSNFVSKTLNNYLANKSNATEREKSMERILGVLSETFYKMMKNKVDKEVEQMRKSVEEGVKNEQKELNDSLVMSNEGLQVKVTNLQQQINKLQEENKKSKQSTNQQTTLPQAHQLLQTRYHQLMCKYRSVQEQNQTLKSQRKCLQQQLLAYQQQVNQTTQKLIESYEESNALEVQKLSNQLKAQRQLTATISKEIKGLKGQLQVGKKNLLKQLQNIENLFEKITQLTEEKDFFEKQFAQLKNLLADKEVAIIKLENKLSSVTKNQQTHQRQHKQQFSQHKQQFSQHKQQFSQHKQQFSQHKQQFSQQQQANQSQHDNNQTLHQCECSQEVTSLRQKNQDLQQEIYNLDRQLKEILFKETIDQEIQTQQGEIQQEQQQHRIKKGKENVLISSLTQQNRETSKIITQPKNIHPNPHINQQATKQAHINNFNISSENNFNTQHQAISHYYLSSMGQQWATSAFNKFAHLTIGKTIEEGMCHIFLPFSSDIYIGVTASEEGKNFTSYQDYISHESSSINENLAREPIYILDLKDFNLRTNEMLRECSLVLVVKVERKNQISMGNKVMVSGKIQFALGFQDDDMVIKNYSHFLQE